MARPCLLGSTSVWHTAPTHLHVCTGLPRQCVLRNARGLAEASEGARALNAHRGAALELCLAQLHDLGVEGTAAGLGAVRVAQPPDKAACHQQDRDAEA